MDFKILPETSIEELLENKILPEWMAKDCLDHGMECAENILNEYDWDWDWDLGDGYDEEQKMVLRKVRKAIITSFNKEGLTGYSFAQKWTV